MPGFFNIPRKKLLSLLGQHSSDSISRVCERFLQVFLDHGVEASQIPRLLPEIKLEDLQSAPKLLTVLTPAVIDKTAQLFGVRSQWLEGLDDEIYDYLAVYKEPVALLERLSSICAKQAERPIFPLRVLTTSKSLNWRDDNTQYLAPVLVERIATLGETDISRYHIYRDGFDWSHSPGRIELKAISRVVYDALCSPVPLFVINRKEMDGILDGRLIPRRYLNGCQITNPSLEDYALSLEQTHLAKEVEELPAVIAYIDAHKLRGYSLASKVTLNSHEEPAKSATVPPLPETSSPPKKVGKRQEMTDAWTEARAYAKARWGEDRSISIEDMVRRIKSIKTLKVSAFTPSAIRKHIAELAPVGVRGKSGRRPKQST